MVTKLVDKINPNITRSFIANSFHSLAASACICNLNMDQPWSVNDFGAEAYCFSPNHSSSTSLPRPPFAEAGQCAALEYIPNGHDYPAVATVRAPLIKESGIRDSSVWNAEVTGVGGIVEIRTELQLLVFSDAEVL